MTTSQPGIQPQGATNNGNLLVPNKQMQPFSQPSYGTDMRAIERWCNSLIASIAAGLYKSLTGAGTTTTPGDLVQEGGFTINDIPGDGIHFFTNGEMLMESVGQASFESFYNNLSLSALNGAVLVEAGSGPIQLAAGPNGAMNVFTADVLADLETPVPPYEPGWGFTNDGHIYFYPSGGPWGLKV